MALFLKHDFYVNFNGAVDAKDEEFAKDIISDEIAKAIVFDRDHVVNFINAQGINFKKRKSDTALLRTIFANRKKKNVSKGMATIILENNERPLKEAREAGKKFINKHYAASADVNQPLTDDETKDNVSAVIEEFNDQDILKTEQLVDTHKNNKTMIQQEGGYYRKMIIKTAIISSAASILVTSATFLIIGYMRKKKGATEAAGIVAEIKNTEVAPAAPKIAAQDYNENTFKPQPSVAPEV